MKMSKKMLHERLNMRRMVLPMLAFILAAASVGCGTTAPVRITERPEVQQLVAAGLTPRL
jgi:hypothetical protein